MTIKSISLTYGYTFATFSSVLKSKLRDGIFSYRFPCHLEFKAGSKMALNFNLKTQEVLQLFLETRKRHRKFGYN